MRVKRNQNVWRFNWLAINWLTNLQRFSPHDDWILKGTKSLVIEVIGHDTINQIVI